MKQIWTLALAMLVPFLGFSLQPQFWTVDISQIPVDDTRFISPSKAHYFSLNLAEWETALNQAPAENTGAGMLLDVPHPGGGMVTLRIWKYEMMESGLSSRFPEISTFLGYLEDMPQAVVRMDYTLQGIHLAVFEPGQTWYIDPVLLNNTVWYQAYFKRDWFNPETFACMVNEESEEPEGPTGAETILPNGTNLKTYRLAMSTTGEYSTFHGGTVPLVLSAVVTAMNRVNGIYERDVAVRMTLIANTDLLFFLNAGTDPFTNNDGGTMLGQNQTTITNIIGSANYDIGHVFSTGGGGIANLGCVCSNNNKARGVTGLGSPIGDPFYVDYVAHEIGHQFNASHTFNSPNGSCSGNRSANNAYEPGSGTTIMAYAGICSPDNVQNNSDDYFHVRSYRSIVAFITSGNGGNCDAATSTGNAAPTVVAPADGFYIPTSTPFRLTAVGNDANGDALTYCWEEFDRGSAVALTSNPTSGTHPLFRSFNPDTSATRIFPRLTNILANTSDNREKLPYYGRKMSFFVTVRDNRPNGGGASYDTVRFNVDGNSGPFLVTTPTNDTWSTNSTQTVTWDVANTTASPVSCANVNIRLSTDGGLTFPILLASNTPNDGSQTITVPNLMVTETDCRILVEAAGNIFFDISNPNFTIQTGPVIPPVAQFNASDNSICAGQTVSFTDNSSNNPTNWNWTFSGGSPATSSLQNPSNISFAAAGTYTVTLIAGNSGGADTTTTSITVLSAPTATFTTTPANGGLNNGTATANPSGGTGPYSYQWFTSPIQNTQTATNLFPGNNTVTITDANGCSSTFTVVIPDNTGLEENAISFVLYPNPAQTVVNIQGTWEDEALVRIFDISGREIYAQLHPGNLISVPVADLASGWYVLSVSAKGATTNQRFCK